MTEHQPGPRPTAPLRIANCSGFYGDRRAAAREMVEGGPIDVLTGDYLAELTMLILYRKSAKGGAGYASTFLAQMEEVLGTCLDRGIKVVANAGGLDPAGLADRLRQLAAELGVDARVAHLEGDDLLPRLGDLRAAGADLSHLDTGERFEDLPGEPVTANAYLGAWGIVEALGGGADVVVCPRVTDASLVVGPAAWHHGWRRDDWDALAGAVAVGHVLECGAQATGGNYAFFTEVPGLEHPGFPLAEVEADGSGVITKHPGTGGLVSVGTVTAQLLYEIDAPAYPNPDVTTHFDTARLDSDGADRVRISGVRGSPPPPDVKVAINYLGGYRNQMAMVLTGLDIEEKAALAERTLWEAVGGRERFARSDVRLIRSDHPDVDVNAEAAAQLRITVADPDADKVGRAFADKVTEMTLASYPGFFTTAPPGPGRPYGVYWPALVPASAVEPVAVLPDGERVAVPPPPETAPLDGLPADSVVDPGGEAPSPTTQPGAGGARRAGSAEADPAVPAATGSATDIGSGLPYSPATPLEDAGQTGEGPVRTVRRPLGTVIGARSGDKGGNANVGLWARSDAGFEWLDDYLTVERFRQLLPEADGLEVRRHRLANLRALNFVVVGLLDEGVAATARPDPQAKGLGEYLRSRLVDLPEALLADAS